MSAIRTTIAGVPIADSALARKATDFVQDVSTRLLFDRSRRVFPWGSLQGEKYNAADPALQAAGGAPAVTERYPAVSEALLDELSAGQRDAVPAAQPRTGFKQGIVEAFSAGMRDKPETAFGTMNADILEATVPAYVRPNFRDDIRDSRFER
jgi:hypothetical protein